MAAGEGRFRACLSEGEVLNSPSGGCRIEGVLGQGGFGITYRAEELERHVSVAVKEFMPMQMAVRMPDGSVAPKPGLEAEYELRLANQLKVLSHMPGVTLVPCEYDGEAYAGAVAGLESEPEGGARCTRCFELRLDFAARECKRLGCGFFSTTLTVSPHKDAQRINAIGEALAEKYGVKWLPGDFKKRDGYRRSIELSHEFGLYRQNYCGCLYSKSGR